MIPKIIHYCWLSNDPIPSNIQHYMDSWKKYLPDYEFIHWNFDKFDKSSSRWVSEAFDNKKYAFAADYIRLYALYHYGGIYLDMDVEVLKSFNPFLSLQTMMGWQYIKTTIRKNKWTFIITVQTKFYPRRMPFNTKRCNFQPLSFTILPPHHRLK